MKKLFFVLPIVALLAAGCNSSQQAASQLPSQVPVVQNNNPSPTPEPVPSNPSVATSTSAGSNSYQGTLTSVAPDFAAVGGKISIFAEGLPESVINDNPIVVLTQKNSRATFYVMSGVSATGFSGLGQMEAKVVLPDSYCPSKPVLSSGQPGCPLPLVPLQPGAYEIALAVGSGITAPVRFDVIPTEIPQQTIHIDSISPTVGPIGTTITLHVSNFTTGDDGEINIVDAKGMTSFIIDSNDANFDPKNGTLSFSLTSTICRSFIPIGLKCDIGFQYTITPGQYGIYVIQFVNLTSNILQSRSQKSNVVNFEVTK